MIILQSKVFMRKSTTIVLLGLLLFSATGFANVKVNDTGPPATDFTIKEYVSVDAPALIATAQFINLATYDVGYAEDNIVAVKEKEVVITTTKNKAIPAFIDRHRRSTVGYIGFNLTKKMSHLKFTDRHRLSCS